MNKVNETQPKRELMNQKIAHKKLHRLNSPRKQKENMRS